MIPLEGNQPPLLSLSLYLFRPEVKELRQVFSEDIKNEEIQYGHLQHGDETRPYALVVRRGHVTPTSWSADLSRMIGEETINAVSASSSAALAFPVRPTIDGKPRIIANTWGYSGRHIINQDTIDDRFGMICTLNVLDPDYGVRSTDSRSFDDTVKQTRTQASRQISFNEFEFDPMREILDSVTGAPNKQYGDFAKRMTGSHYLKLSCHIEPEEIFKKADEAFHIYQKPDYQERFGWVKTKRSVTNPHDVEKLDERLVDLLASGATTNIHLAPPIVIDWDEVDGFLYLREQEQALHPDLDLVDYLNRLKDRTKLELKDLKNHSIRVKFSGFVPERLAPVYKCLVAEIDVNEDKYILSAGRWFRISKKLVDEVEDRLKSVNVHPPLPPATSFDQREEDYNAVAAKALGGVCMDKVDLRPNDAASTIELCDILTEDLRFIHVKKRESSSTLSHLYAQGFVAAQTVVWEPSYRKKASEAIRSRKEDFGALDKWEKLSPEDIHVIYGIMAESRFEGKERLPFFSKVSLLNAVESLVRLHFKTSVAHIHRPGKP